MQEDGRPLAAEERVRHVGAVVRVGVADGVDARDVGGVALGRLGREPAAPELDAGLGADGAALLVGEAEEEGGALDGVALGELDREEVVLGRRRQRRVGLGVVVGVAEAGDGGDGAVLDRDLVQVEELLELGVLGLGLGAGGLGVGAVGEGDEVGVEGQDLADEGGEVTEGGRQQTEGLVGVLVAVTPGALRGSVSIGSIEGLGGLHCPSSGNSEHTQ